MNKQYDNDIELQVSEYEQLILKHKFGKSKKKYQFHFLHYIFMLTFSLYLIFGFQGVTSQLFTYGYTMYEKYQYQKNKEDFISIGQPIHMDYKQHMDKSNIRQPFSITVDKAVEKSYDGYFQFSIHNQSNYPLLINEVFEKHPIQFVQGGEQEEIDFYPNEKNGSPIHGNIMIMPNQIAKIYGDFYTKSIKEGSYLMIGNNKVDVYQKNKSEASYQKDNTNSFDISHSPYNESDITPKKQQYSVTDTVHFKDDSIKKYKFYDPKEDKPKNYNIRLNRIRCLKEEDISEYDTDYLKKYKLIELELEVQNLSSQTLQLPYADRFLYYEWEPGVYISAETEEFDLEIPAKDTSYYQYKIYVPKQSRNNINLCLLSSKDYMKNSDTSLSVSNTTPLIQNLVPLQWNIPIPKE